MTTIHMTLLILVAAAWIAVGVAVVRQIDWGPLPASTTDRVMLGLTVVFTVVVLWPALIVLAALIEVAKAVTR